MSDNMNVFFIKANLVSDSCPLTHFLPSCVVSSCLPSDPDSRADNAPVLFFIKFIVVFNDVI